VGTSTENIKVGQIMVFLDSVVFSIAIVGLYAVTVLLCLLKLSSIFYTFCGRALLNPELIFPFLFPVYFCPFFLIFLLGKKKKKEKKKKAELFAICQCATGVTVRF
jgi:predicted membrane protein